VVGCGEGDSEKREEDEKQSRKRSHDPDECFGGQAGKSREQDGWPEESRLV